MNPNQSQSSNLTLSLKPASKSAHENELNSNVLFSSGRPPDIRQQPPTTDSLASPSSSSLQPYTVYRPCGYQVFCFYSSRARKKKNLFVERGRRKSTRNIFKRDVWTTEPKVSPQVSLPRRVYSATQVSGVPTYLKYWGLQTRPGKDAVVPEEQCGLEE